LGIANFYKRASGYLRKIGFLGFQNQILDVFQLQQNRVCYKIYFILATMKLNFGELDTMVSLMNQMVNMQREILQLSRSKETRAETTRRTHRETSSTGSHTHLPKPSNPMFTKSQE